MGKLNLFVGVILLIFMFYAVLFFFINGLSGGKPSPNETQINSLIDCIHNYCESKGFESRLEKKSEDDIYIAHPTSFICHDGDELHTYQPVGGIFEECGIEVKPSILERMFFVG